MKSILLLLTIDVTLISAGCYSNNSKKSNSNPTEQPAPMPSQSRRY